MSRYTGPKWKISRRLGFSILETGEELKKRPYAPGQHGNSRRKKISEYGKQLQEKQKVRYMYGLNERQFRKLFLRAKKSKEVKGTALLILLESRLDNIVYRMGITRTRSSARQLVNHGHILVDGKKVDIPSYSVKPGQKISLKEKSRNFKFIKESLDLIQTIPAYVEFDKTKLEGTYVRHPERNELSSEIEENLIIEYYNRFI
ncbi:TPA: 30S ribosomal protein S4 [bacterium]|nr:30S ribosomal protein S4 [bacterium]